MDKRIKAFCVIGIVLAVLFFTCVPGSAQFVLPIDPIYFNSISAGTYLLGYQPSPLLLIPGYSTYTFPRTAAAITLPVDLPSLIGVPPLTIPVISFANPLPLPVPTTIYISPSVLWNPFVFPGIGLL